MNPIELQRLLHNLPHTEGLGNVLSGQIFPAGRQRTLVPRKVAFALGGLSALVLGACSGPVAPVSPAAVGIAPQPIAGEPGLPPQDGEQATAFRVTETPTRAPTRAPTRTPRPTRNPTPTKEAPISIPTTTSESASLTRSVNYPSAEYSVAGIPMSVTIDAKVNNRSILIREGGISQRPGQDTIAGLVLEAFAMQLGLTIQDFMQQAERGPVPIRTFEAAGTNANRVTQLRVREGIFNPRLPIIYITTFEPDRQELADRLNDLGGDFEDDDVSVAYNNAAMDMPGPNGNPSKMRLFSGWALSKDGQLAVIGQEPYLNLAFQNSGYVVPVADFAQVLTGIRYLGDLVANGDVSNEGESGSRELYVDLQRLSMGNPNDPALDRYTEWGIVSTRAHFLDALGPFDPSSQDPNAYNVFTLQGD